MEYEVWIDNTFVGFAKTLGIEKTGHKIQRLLNIFGTIATQGLPDREEPCEFDIDWPLIDHLNLKGPYRLQAATYQE